MRSSNFTWLAGLRYLLQSMNEGWGSGIYLCSTKLFWRTGFGAILARERPYVGCLWIIKYDGAWGGGVQMRSMGPMRCGFDKISGGVEGSFLIKQDLR